jgi:hypothetical protein
MPEQSAAAAADNQSDEQGGGQVESSAGAKGDASGAASEAKDDTGATGEGPGMNAPAAGAAARTRRGGRGPGSAGVAAGGGATGAAAEGAHAGATSEGGSVSAVAPGFAALGVNFAGYFNAQLRKATNPVKVSHKAKQWIVSQIDEQGVRVTEAHGGAVEYVEPTLETLAYLLSQVAHL